MATTKPSSGNVQLRPESREPDDAANGNFTIYLRHLQVAVSTVLRERGDLRELFSPEEQALATLLLPQEGNGSDVLSREARGLYTRMLQRKGPWFRLESLIKYDELLSGRQEGGEDGVALRQRWTRAQRAVSELKACSLVSCITSPRASSCTSPPCKNPPKREVLEAISACLRLDEIKTLVTRVARHSASSMSRRDALAALASASVGQRTLTHFFKKHEVSEQGAGGIDERLVHELAAVLAPCFRGSGGTGAQGRGGGGASMAQEEERAGQDEQADSYVLLIKIEESGKRVLRRMLRLLYMGAAGGNAHGAGTAGMTVCSPVLNPALMADFGLVTYCNYKCVVRTRLFGSRRRFLQWEAAVELRNVADLLEAHGIAARELETLARALGPGEGHARSGAGAGGSAASASLRLGADGEQAEQGHIDLTVSPAKQRVATRCNTQAASCSSPCWTRARGAGRCGGGGAEQDRIDLTGEVDDDEARTSSSKALSQAAGLAGQRGDQEGKRGAGEGGGGDEIANNVGGDAMNAGGHAVTAAGVLWVVREAVKVFLPNEVFPNVLLSDRERHLGLQGLKPPADASELSIQLATFAGRLLRCYLWELVAASEGQTSGSPRIQICSISKSRDLRPEQAGNDDATLMEAIGKIETEWGGGGKAYLRQLDAGYHLCAVVWCGIDAMERARCYSDCVPLLRLILATPFLQHRRGRIFNRLALDLQHLAKETRESALNAEALMVCDKALGDLAVTGGDRLTLMRRRARLLALEGKASGGGAPGGMLSRQGEHLERVVGKKDRHGHEALGAAASYESLSSDDFQADARGVAVRDGDAHNSVQAKRNRKSQLKKGRDKRAKGTDPGEGMGARAHGSPETLDVAERIGHEELVYLGIISEDERDAKPPGGNAGGCRDDAGTKVTSFLSALQDGGGEYAMEDDVIEATRLGNKTVGRKSRFAGFDVSGADAEGGSDGQVCGVEVLALQHYMQSSQGSWFGLHCEGACFRTLFGILFWDIIFSSEVPDVFLTRYQDAPLDLNTFPDFYQNRKFAISARLALLKAATQAQLCDMVEQCWRAHHGTLCRVVRWQAWSLKFLQLVAVCMGGKGLAGIGRTLCVNYRHFSGGLPDLVLLKGSRRCRAAPGQRANVFASVQEGEIGLGSQGPVEGRWEPLDLNVLVGKGGIASGGLEVQECGVEEIAVGKGKSAAVQRSMSARRRHGTRGVVALSEVDEGAAMKRADVEGWHVLSGEGSAGGEGEGAEEEGLELDHELYEYEFAVKLVEVKGPNDTLMDRQKAWISILRTAGIETRVCRVVESRHQQTHKKRADCDKHAGADGEKGNEDSPEEPAGKKSKPIRSPAALGTSNDGEHAAGGGASTLHARGNDSCCDRNRLLSSVLSGKKMGVKGQADHPKRSRLTLRKNLAAGHPASEAASAPAAVLSGGAVPLKETRVPDLREGSENSTGNVQASGAGKGEFARRSIVVVD